jgi:predicted RNA binding protein YcfA (HicA-like mRNA interferase family)
VDREIHPVARIDKLRNRLQSRFGERNFAFEDLRAILLSLGFDERVRGSHHIFTRSEIAEIVNLQPVGRLAKPYQVRQVREIINRHGL